MSMVFICDECGKQNTKPINLATGHIYVDGKYLGLSCDLCREHYPKIGYSQPNNCKRVVFSWPKSHT